MVKKLIISVMGEDITKKPVYCGNGNFIRWKKKVGKKIISGKKYLIHEISNEGPYGMPWFQVRSLVTTPEEFKDYALNGGCSDKIQTIGFELNKKTKKILEDISLGA